MNPKDLIGCGTTGHLRRCGGTQVPGCPGPLPGQIKPLPRPSAAPASRSLSANVIQCRAQQFHLRSFARSRDSSNNLHNAQRSNPAVASPGTTTLHWTTLHEIIQHYITLHYTSPTPRRPALCCLSSACLSVAQSVSSRLWYHPIPPATACRPSHSRPRPHTQTQTQFADLGQTSLVPTVSQRLRPISFLYSFLPSSFCSLRCLPLVLHPKASWSNPARSSTPPPPGCVCRP